jgi:hypothetical protein
MDIASRPSADGHRRTLREIVRQHLAGSRRLPEAPPGGSTGHRPLCAAGLPGVRRPAQRRSGSLRRPERLADVDAWIGGARAWWQSRLDTLHIEIPNERKTRR